MTDVNDMELLRDYDRHGSEAAFAALVQRHIHLVYSVALRHTGIAAHAEEITQAVFIILARKAASLRPNTILEGWLHETTRLTALSFLRGERRRQFREQEAYMQSTLPPANDAALWNQLAPMLDEAVSRLGKKDRDAVMLRFFKDKNLREVAAALDMSEAAAQRRVHRAVEKLRGFYTKRGVTLTAAVLTAAISANSVQAAPVGLAASVTATVVKGAVVSGSTLTLIKGALKIMAWMKMKTAVVVGVSVLLAAGTAAIVLSSQDEPPLSPDVVLRKVQGKYASLFSYLDTGTATTRNSDGKLISTIQFKTMLLRTNLYRFDWKQRQRYADQTNSGAIWFDGNGHFFQLNGGASERFDSFAGARGAAMTPTTGWFQGVLAPYYTFNGTTGWVSHVDYLMEGGHVGMLTRTERIQGYDCYVIDGTRSNRTITVWIDKNYLIRQVREDYHDAANPGAVTKLTTTQTHENITTAIENR